MAMALLILAGVATLSSVAQESNLLSDGFTGRRFIVAFPENIAIFYPVQPKNKVIITALYHQTEVVIAGHELQTATLSLRSGESQAFHVEAHLELSRSEICNSSLQISSNKPITVRGVHQKDQSIQTSVVIPTHKLGTDYLIPPVPVIKGTSSPADQVTTFVTENNPFRVIIINTGQDNTVILTGAGSKNISLLPHQVASVWLQPEDAFRAVSATVPVAVLFGHACAHLRGCTCSQLYTALPPTKADRQTFYVPPFLTKDAGNKTYVLVSERGSRRVQPANQASPVLEAPGSAVLYRPGLLLPLIPESDHGACWLVSSTPDVTNVAVIVVHRSLRAGVHLGRRSLGSLDWQQLDGNDYASLQIDLESEVNVIWHASSTMAVYSLGIKDGQMFGSPAASVSKSAEVVRVGHVAGGWRESLRYCRNQQLELLSFPGRQHQTQVYNKILQDKEASPRDLWIGLRRSSHSGRWYWLSDEPVAESDWAEGEPGVVGDAQCALMTPNSHNFSWRDENCCRDAHPVCYKDPALLPM